MPLSFHMFTDRRGKYQISSDLVNKGQHKTLVPANVVSVKTTLLQDGTRVSTIRAIDFDASLAPHTDETRALNLPRKVIARPFFMFETMVFLPSGECYESRTRCKSKAIRYHNVKVQEYASGNPKKIEYRGEPNIVSLAKIWRSLPDSTY